MKSAFLVLGISILFISCEKDEDTPQPTQPTVNLNTNNNPDTSGNNIDTTNNSITFNNSYMFSDDKVECFPHTSMPSINSNGILSVVSKPCSNSGSKLDGYFKWKYRPAPGSYKITGKIGSIPNTLAMATDEFSLIFYGHGQSTLYSTGGTVEVSKNKSDSTKLNLDWKDVEMTFSHDSSTIKFSGNLSGL